MKLVRIGDSGHETPAVLTSDGKVVDVSHLTNHIDGDFPAWIDLHALADAVSSRIEAGKAEMLTGRRVGPPIARPHQVLCIRLNYADHAVESGMPIPHEPIVLDRSPHTVVGPHDDVVIPRGSVKADWEVELGVAQLGLQRQQLVAAGRVTSPQEMDHAQRVDWRRQDAEKLCRLQGGDT